MSDKTITIGTSIQTDVPRSQVIADLKQSGWTDDDLEAAGLT
jgi:hypothetical protein